MASVLLILIVSMTIPTVPMKRRERSGLEFEEGLLEVLYFPFLLLHYTDTCI